MCNLWAACFGSGSVRTRGAGLETLDLGLQAGFLDGCSLGLGGEAFSGRPCPRPWEALGGPGREALSACSGPVLCDKSLEGPKKKNDLEDTAVRPAGPTALPTALGALSPVEGFGLQSCLACRLRRVRPALN